jgi:uncharacterized membrane protein (UPF0127 family)
LVAALDLLALLLVGSNRPVNSRLACTAEAGAPAVPGFGEIAFTVRQGGGLPPTTARQGQLCALLAVTPEQQARGMMGRRDLAGYDAMVFQFPADTSAAFYNKNVPIALSLVWFAADGRYLGAKDMPACGDQPDCPQYAPPRPFRFAVEVPQGGLPRLGVGPGSVLTLG